MARAIGIALLIVVGLTGCWPSASPPDSVAEPQSVVESKKETPMSHPELEFFNSLAGKLQIELTVPPVRIGNLENVRATPEAKIKSLKFVAEVFDRDSQTTRELTSEELQSVAFRAAQIKLRGEGGDALEHRSPNGEYFTVQDLLNAVAETERQTRDNSEWFDGVDVHHIFFEGIHPGDDGVWEIYWGS